MILSLQLYSLRDFLDFDESLQFCLEKGLRHVEPAGLYGHSAAELAAKVTAAGLSAHSFHFGLDVLQADWQQFAEVLPSCGATDFVMPFADAQNLVEVQRLAADLQDLAVKLADAGIQLHYHNHAHELARHFEGKSYMDWLLELAPNLNWQMDVGWVCAGGADVPAKMRQWQERISMLHIKDILAKDAEGPVESKKIDGVEIVLSAAAQKGGQPARIGDGIVDFASIFSVAKAQGIETFILENDNPTEINAFVDSGIELVKKYIA